LLDAEEHGLNREIVGSELWAMTMWRPEISWVVSRLSQFLVAPTQVHLRAAKHALRYLAATAGLQLRFTRRESLRVVAFSDSDWATDEATRKSVTGYVDRRGSRSLDML